MLRLNMWHLLHDSKGYLEVVDNRYTEEGVQEPKESANGLNLPTMSKEEKMDFYQWEKNNARRLSRKTR